MTVFFIHIYFNEIQGIKQMNTLCQRERKIYNVTVKRFLLLAMLMFSSMLLHAKTGLGIQGGIRFTPSPEGCFGITGRSESSPWGVEISYDFREESINLVLDNWWIYKRIDSNLNWFALWGLSFGGRLKNEAYLDTGSRVGIGLNAFCFESRCLELYAQAAWNPTVGIDFDRDGKKYSVRVTPACFPVNAGIRFWL